MFKLSKSSKLNLAEIYRRAENLFSQLPLLQRLRRRRRRLKILKYTGYFLLTVFLAGFTLLCAQILGLIRVYHQAEKGRAELNQALAAAEKKDWQSALISSALAADVFSSAERELKELKKTLPFTPPLFLERELAEADYLLSSAELASRAVSQGAGFAASLENFLPRGKANFSQLNREEKRKLLEKIYWLMPDLVGMKSGLDLALLNLNRARLNGLFFPLKNQVLTFGANLNRGEQLLGRAIVWSKFLPPAVGYPRPATYLVVIKNSERLSPLGGRANLYGILTLADGELLEFKTAPAAGLFASGGSAVDWPADWPTSARKMAWSYENFIAPGARLDGVIVLPEKMIAELIDTVAPLKVGEREYRGEDFLALTKNTAPSRLEMVGEIIKSLKEEMFKMPASYWPSIVEIAAGQAKEKNLALYFKDTELENLITKENLGGELKQTNDDYLMIVDTAQNGSIGENFLSKSLNYSLAEGRNGLLAKLKISYAHNRPVGQGENYQTYVKVYLPLGSQLIKSEGAKESEVSAKNELGKTVFGAPLTLLPDEISSLYFEYKLAEKVNQAARNGRYKLYLQKQPDNSFEYLLVDFKTENEIKSYKPTGFYAEKIGDNRIRWESDWRADREFEINLKTAGGL